MSASLVKDILMNSGDQVSSGLPFKSTRRLNVAKVVKAASASVTGQYRECAVAAAAAAAAVPAQLPGSLALSPVPAPSMHEHSG